MILETERLILRPWMEYDAEDLFRYASDERVGPQAGWPVHRSVEESSDVIRNVLSQPETYAVCLKENNKAIGSVGLMVGEYSPHGLNDDEGELGCWIGVDFWGQGLIPEALRELMRYAFEDLGLNRLWYGYYEGNDKSRRVMEKLGFTYHHTIKDTPCELMGDIRTEHMGCLEREDIREAVNDDLNSLLELYLHLHEQSIPERDERLMGTWKRIMDDEDHHIIVKTVSGKIVSSCVCVIIPNLTRNVRPYAFIENVVTDEKYRGNGYASQCLEYAGHIAWAAGCYKMMLLTGSKNENTLGFYRKAGYNSEDKTAFIRWLE